MGRIRILPDALASQVAAGEVVERPAAVVRELVENSLDAGATHVEVHFQRGGAALIRVGDNGHGMDREDTLMCLERHATSKIRTKEDLGAIRSFGFRGEALPSIASVSRFRLATRMAESLSGTEVEIHGGRMQAVRDHGGAPGTVVEVRSLFYNVPARRKFLRTEQTESAHIEHQFRLHALAHPAVAFTLMRDGETMFHLPPGQSLLSRIEGLSGRDLARRLLEVPAFTLHGITVSGFISAPGVSRANRQMQLTFLNGRPVESSVLGYGLREGYHTALMKGQHPVTFLFIGMPPESFDINVHPAKKEVRFHDGIAVREAVTQAVARALASSTNITSGHGPMRREPDHEATFSRPFEQSPVLIPESAPTSPRQDWTARSSAQDGQPDQADEAARPQAPPGIATRGHHADVPDSVQSISSSGFRILGVIHKLYVLMESREGLVLMDQHAAHERVLYEQVRRAMESEGVPAQRLLMPITLQVPPRDFDVLNRNLPTLHRLGIDAEPFGNNALKVDALPAFLKSYDPAALLRDLLDELSSAGSRTSALRLGEDMIASTACRHAVKANDHLREPELRKLLEDLLACEMPYCCPHGRPTLIQMSLAELERKFGRRAP